MDRDALLAKKLYNRQFILYAKAKEESKSLQKLRTDVYKVLGSIGGKKILFAGCGNGKECIPAVKRGAKVTGIDISENTIELAKRQCKPAEFHIMDFEKTKFKAGSFDIVVSVLAVMYKKDLSSVLNEFRRIVKDNGCIILAVPHPVIKMTRYSNMDYFIKGKKWETWKGIRRFNYYRLFEDYVDSFVKSRLKLIKLAEPHPCKEKDYPHFVIFKLIKD